MRMNDSLAGTKHAEKLFTGRSGATMDEVITATGGPQYNVLRRLEAKGYTIRKTKEGRATRYYAQPPDKMVYDMSVNRKGQVTLPERMRAALGIEPGRTLRAVVDGGRLVIETRKSSIDDLFGILHQPGMRPRTLKEIEAGIAEGAVASATGISGKRR